METNNEPPVVHSPKYQIGCGVGEKTMAELGKEVDLNHAIFS